MRPTCTTTRCLQAMIGCLFACHAGGSAAAPADAFLEEAAAAIAMPQAAMLQTAMPPPIAEGDTVSATVAQHTLSASGWIAIDNDALADMRGGFTPAPGLKIEFGIERAVTINGNLVSSASFHLQDAGKLTAGGSGLAASGAGMRELVQNGVGNTVQAGQLSQAAAATFIQNTLNDQAIQSLTVINATTNSLELLKGLNLQSVLNDSLVNALGVR